MEMIKLIHPSIEYKEDISAFRQEILAANERNSFAGCSFLGICDSAEEWIEKVSLLKNRDTCPTDLVPASTYLAIRISDNRIIGCIDLRHHIDHPILGAWGGHIGYTVRPCERGKGYAKEMLRLNLQNCRNRNMDKIMISCDWDNPASEKTILAYGGVFEKEVRVDENIMKRYWITL